MGVALGVGGLAASFGKLLVSLSFLLWFAIGQLLVLMLAIELEIGNIKDAPENRFRKIMVRHKWITIMLQSTAFIALLFYLQHRSSPDARFKAYFQIATLVLLPTVYSATRTLRINRSRYAIIMLIGTVMIVVTQAVVGFINAPTELRQPACATSRQVNSTHHIRWGMHCNIQ